MDDIDTGKPVLHVTENPMIGVPWTSASPTAMDPVYVLVPRIFSLCRELQNALKELEASHVHLSRSTDHAIEDLHNSLTTVRGELLSQARSFHEQQTSSLEERFRPISQWSLRVDQCLESLEELIHLVSDSESSHFTFLQNALSKTLADLREHIESTEEHLRLYVRSEVLELGLMMTARMKLESRESMVEIRRMMKEMESSLIAHIDHVELRIRKNIWSDLVDNAMDRLKTHLRRMWRFLQTPLGR
jgi:phytoene dehydrogenase-like protein